MTVGKILQIDSQLKRNAEGTTPVFAGGAGKINTSVPRQITPMIQSSDLLAGAMVADVEATGELVNLLKVGAEVYDNNEKTKKYNAQLEIEGDYKKFKIDKQKEFSTAYTAKDKEVVRQSYDVGVAKLNSKVKGMGWDSLKDLTWAQNLSIDGRSTLAEMQSKTSLALHKETVTNFTVQLGENEKDFANKANIDPIRHMDDGVALYEKIYDIGGMTKPQFLAGVRAYKNKVTLSRANLLASDFAKEVSVHDLPTMDEIIVGLQKRLGLPLTNDLLEQAHETFKTSFFNEIKLRNQANAYGEKLKDLEFSVFRQTVNNDIAGYLADNVMTNKRWDEKKALARTKGDTKLFGQLNLQQIEWNKSIEVDSRVFNWWTTGQGQQELWNPKLELNEHGVWDLEKVVEHIRRSDGEYSHTGENTIQGIRTAFKKMNDALKSKRTDEKHIATVTHTWLIDKVSRDTAGKSPQDMKDYYSKLFKIDPAVEINQLILNQMGSTEKWADAMYKSSGVYRDMVQAIEIKIKDKIQRDRDQGADNIFSYKGFNQPFENKDGKDGWGIKFRRFVEGEMERALHGVASQPTTPSQASTDITNTGNKLSQATTTFNQLKTGSTVTSPSSTSSASASTKVPLTHATFSDLTTLSTAKTIAKNKKVPLTTALQALGKNGGDPSATENDLNKAKMQNSTNALNLKPSGYTPATGGFTSRTDAPLGDGTSIFDRFTPKSDNQLTKTLDDLKQGIAPEWDIVSAPFVNLWDSVFGDSPDKPAPEPKALNAEDWRNVSKANQAQALKGVVDLGVKIKEGVTGLGKDVAETVGAVATGLKETGAKYVKHRESEFAKLHDGSVNHFIDARLQDIGVGRVGEFGEIVAEEIESDIKTSSESIMNNLGFLDFEFDTPRFTTDIKGGKILDIPLGELPSDIGDLWQEDYENKMTFLSDVSLQLNEEMAGVSQALQDDMTFSLGEITTGFRKTGDALTPSIGKDFDPSDIGYNPAQNTGVEAPMFDPAMAQQIIKPIVQEVTKSIQMSLSPESIELPDRFEALDPTGKDKATLDLEWLENWAAEKKREKARLAPLKEAKDITKVQHKPDTKDFAHEQKRKRFIFLYNKNVKNMGAITEFTDGYSTKDHPTNRYKRLSAKEKREFEKLIKYLQDREMIPQG
jgi:hypothetical protein